MKCKVPKLSAHYKVIVIYFNEKIRLIYFYYFLSYMVLCHKKHFLVLLLLLP